MQLLTWHRRVRTVLALTPAVVITITLALAGLVLVRYWAWQPVLAASVDAVGTYLQTVGTIYAVLLAFVVYVVWQQFNEARLQVDREANEIVDLYRTAKGLPEEPRRQLHLHLRRYTEEVLEHEWRAMATNDEATLDRIGRILDQAWEGLHAFEPTTGCHSAHFAEALSRFNDLCDLRSMRLTTARLRIPFAMRLLLYFGAMIVIGSTWMLHVQAFEIHALITGAMAGSISHVLYLIWDLDDCFAGDWRVSRAALRRALRYMDEASPS